MCRLGLLRRRACSATRARRVTASAVAWQMAARVCHKYCPWQNLKASSLGSYRAALTSASMGEDVEEAQELAVDAPGSAHYARQEGVGNTSPRGIGLQVATHLGPRCGLKEFVWLVVPELPIEADVDHVVAVKLVDECHSYDLT